jgi:ligand-binding sensor domain-containing protein
MVSIIAPGQPKQEYLFYHLGSRNGLLSNEVMDVAQDANGFIWIATLSGLQRFDGRRFLTFQHNPDDPNSLPADAVFGVRIDKKGRLWLRCQENRMGYFNTTDFKFHEVPVRYPETIVRNADCRFQIDNDGNPMVVLINNAILTYNEAANEFDSKHNPFQLPVNWIPVGISQDNINNDYWIATNLGLVKYSVKEKVMSYRGHNVTKDPVIDAFAELKSTALPFFDNSGRFWLLSWTLTEGPRFFSYEIKTKELINWEPLFSTMLKGKYHETAEIKQQRDGTLWVFGAIIFVKFNERKKTFELVESNLPGEFSIRYDGVRNILEDKEHNLWVCTNKGLYRFNPADQFFHTIPNRRTDDDKVYTTDVSDIVQLRNGDIVVSTWGNGLFAYDKDFNPIKRDYVEQGMKLGEGLTWSIHERANGDIWRANQDGFLFIYHADKKKSERIQHPVFKRWTIRQITEDKTGNLWFGTQGGHLVKWNADTDSFSLIQKLPSTINRLYTDLRGDIWACTKNNGVFRINSKDGSVIINYSADSPKEQKLLLTSAADIIQYDDSLYIIASGGLNILNIRTSTIRYESTVNGLPSNSVSNIVKDRRGHLWLAIESGVCSINMKNSVVSTYNENDGLPTVDFNGGAACILNDGRIVMGTTHELITFDQAQVEKFDFTPPDVKITGFVLMNKPLLIDSLVKLPEISLKPQDNSIIIEFSTLTFQNSYGISYMLEGLDKEWVRKSTAQTQAVYSYIPPGTYTFKIRSENGEGVYSKKITVLKIIVHYPFWQTWWFFCLLGLTVAAIIYWLDKQRINKIVALQKVRSEIAGNLHEEVNTTLNNINLLSEMARIKADKEIDRSKEFIEQISSKSHNMIIAMDDILWSIDPDNDSMEKSLLRMMEFADVLKNLYGASIEIALDKKVRSLKPDMKTRHEVFLIFKQVLTIIVQYSSGKKTLVHIDLFKNKLSVKLQDTTATLDKNIVEIEESIKDMHTRAGHIGAELDVQQDKNGITVILLIPVK